MPALKWQIAECHDKARARIEEELRWVKAVSQIWCHNSSIRDWCLPRRVHLGVFPSFAGYATNVSNSRAVERLEWVKAMPGYVKIRWQVLEMACNIWMSKLQQVSVSNYSRDWCLLVTKPVLRILTCQAIIDVKIWTWGRMTQLPFC